MSDRDFVLSYRYPVAPETLYGQFATADGVRHWWTKNCDMDERVGGQASFSFPDAGFHARVKIERLDEYRCVEWSVMDAKHPESSGWVDLHDWVGTTIRFEIESLGEGQSRLRFTHAGLWQFYLNQSLRRYLEEGRGEPYEDDPGR